MMCELGNRATHREWGHPEQEQEYVCLWHNAKFTNNVNIVSLVDWIHPWSEKKSVYVNGRFKIGKSSTTLARTVNPSEYKHWKLARNAMCA